MNAVFYEPVGGCCAGFGASDGDACSQALLDARANRPDWSPGIATCFDPSGLNDGMIASCHCQGYTTFWGGAAVQAAQAILNAIRDRLSPKPGPGQDPTKGGSKGTTDTGGGGGGAALTGAALLAWLLMGK